MSTTDRLCVDCGNKLTAEEITYYGMTCNTCEGKASDAFSELEGADSSDGGTAVIAESASSTPETPFQVLARLLFEVEMAPKCNVNVVEAIEFRRNAYGLNKQQMARVLGIHPTRYSEFTDGRRSLPREAVRRAAIIGVPVSALLNWDIAPAAPGSPTPLLRALKYGIPLKEPVRIRSALLAQREAHVVLNGGTGPLSAVHLVNIGLTGWTHTPETAKAYADGYNTARKQYRSALLDYAEAAPIDAAPAATQDTRCMAELIGDTLVILLGSEALVSGARQSQYFFDAAENDDPLVVTDATAFLRSVVNALNSEQEDGSTPVSRMIDKAIKHVCEYGEPGIEPAPCGRATKR